MIKLAWIFIILFYVEFRSVIKKYKFEITTSNDVKYCECVCIFIHCIHHVVTCCIVCKTREGTSDDVYVWNYILVCRFCVTFIIFWTMLKVVVVNIFPEKKIHEESEKERERKNLGVLPRLYYDYIIIRITYLANFLSTFYCTGTEKLSALHSELNYQFFLVMREMKKKQSFLPFLFRKSVFHSILSFGHSLFFPPIMFSLWIFHLFSRFFFEFSFGCFLFLWIFKLFFFSFFAFPWNYSIMFFSLR